MELKDTVEMMNSADYKERFKAEYQQVVIRYKKLRICLLNGIITSLYLSLHALEAHTICRLKQ